MHGKSFVGLINVSYEIISIALLPRGVIYE